MYGIEILFLNFWFLKTPGILYTKSSTNPDIIRPHACITSSVYCKQSGVVHFLPVVCQDCVNGRLWSYDSNHMVGEWISGGYPSCNQVSQLVRTSTQSQASGKS